MRYKIEIDGFDVAAFSKLKAAKLQDEARIVPVLGEAVSLIQPNGLDDSVYDWYESVLKESMRNPHVWHVSWRPIGDGTSDLMWTNAWHIDGEPLDPADIEWQEGDYSTWGVMVTDMVKGDDGREFVDIRFKPLEQYLADLEGGVA